MDKTFAKGIRLLETLVEAGEPATVTELARRCELTKSNAHRLLATLQELGYVSQHAETKRYVPTLKLWELGATVVGRLTLREVAAPFLRELNEITGETTHLSVLDRGEIIYIDKLEAKHAVRTYTRIGGRAPAYCVATGKAMLSHQDEWLLEEVSGHLLRFTDRTLTDPIALREELYRIREQGYSLNRGEWRGGAYGLAVPVHDSTERVVAAIGISAPEDRMPQPRIDELVPILKRIGGDMSRALGSRKSQAA
jgi:DNA-binding IclR family transcriptional regulator